MDRVAGNANTGIGAEVAAGLYIDESTFEKKGVCEKPVGVARQRIGCLGKRDNCVTAPIHLGAATRPIPPTSTIRSMALRLH
jgi:hypothetical protein